MKESSIIFISYGKNDKKIVKDIYLDLKNVGITPWMDDFDLLPGQNWRLAIKSAIKKSDYILAVLSSRTLSQRGFVHKEHATAFELLDEMPETAILVIPVRVDDCAILFPANISSPQRTQSSRYV